MSIAQKCKVEGCNGLGHLENGRRYFSKGLCTKHYTRKLRGIPLEQKSRKDRRHAIKNGETAKILLGVDGRQGYAIVDIEDAWVDKYNWCLFQNGYASRKGQYLHHLIAGKPENGMQVDHINRNRLDNRRSNLRIVTSSQNNANMSSTNKNGYRGITKVGNKYAAYISKNYKGHYLGLYHTPEEAANAYNKKSIELYGENAVTNIIKETK